MQRHAAGSDQRHTQIGARTRRRTVLPRTSADSAHGPWKGAPSDAGTNLGIGRDGPKTCTRVPKEGIGTTEDRPRALDLTFPAARAFHRDLESHSWSPAGA